MRTTSDKAQKNLITPSAGDSILRALIQSSPVAIIAIDLEKKIILWNPAAERMFGWKEEEVLGKPNPIIPKDRQEEFGEFVARAEKGDFISDVGVKRLKKDGSLVDVSISTASIRDPEGKVIGIIALFSDITGRKQMEKALLEEKNRTEAIIAAIGDGISIQDTNFKILYENQVQKDIIGDHLGEYCYMAYERREDACEGCPVAKVFKDGKIHKAERNAPTDKGMITVEITASPLKDASGKIVAGIEVIRDITERKRAEEALFEAKHDWEDTFNTITDMITVHDKDFNIIRANKAAEKILGLSFLEGKSCGNIYRDKGDTEI